MDLYATAPESQRNGVRERKPRKEMDSESSSQERELTNEEHSKGKKAFGRTPDGKGELGRC